MTQWPEFKNSKEFKSIFNNYLVRSYWVNIFNKVYKNQIKTWDYQWVYSVWLYNGLSILPNRNLVSNIGFGIDSNFTNDKSSKEANMISFNIDLPLNHLNMKLYNYEEQRYVEKNIYKIIYTNL